MSESIGEEDAETKELKKGIPLEVEEEVEPLLKPPSGGGGGGPPFPQPMPPIHPLVRPRGLPIRVPQNLKPLDMPGNLP